jgi:hypothetical protein
MTAQRVFELGGRLARRAARAIGRETARQQFSGGCLVCGTAPRDHFDERNRFIPCEVLLAGHASPAADDAPESIQPPAPGRAHASRQPLHFDLRGRHGR